MGAVRLTGTTTDGVPVLVTIWDEAGLLDSTTREPLAGELAVKVTGRWSVPVILEEDQT